MGLRVVPSHLTAFVSSIPETTGRVTEPLTFLTFLWNVFCPDEIVASIFVPSVNF